MKKCNNCNETKELTEFHSTGYDTLVDGTRVKKHKPDCKICANKKWKKRITERLDEIVDEWKCSECGYDKSRAALEFHHLDPTKKDFSISSRWTISHDKLKEEIDKCIMLCANCHRELHEEIKGL